MNGFKPWRRLWPRSVRARAALAAALAAAVLLAGIGWWVHREVYRKSTEVATMEALHHAMSLADEVREGVIPPRTGIVPFEVVATGRSTAVAYGGGMDDFRPDVHHVLPAPTSSSGSWDIRMPVNPDFNPGLQGDVPGGVQRVMWSDIEPGELSREAAAALGVATDARVRVYVVVLPTAAKDITDSVDGMLVRAGLAGLVLIAGVAYLTVRIALRPVEAIRVLTASVTPNNPRERVTVPASGHEIAALATTINTTLERLDTAAAQQRRFVADAAHELRSPLTTLLTSLEVALAYPERTDWPAAVTTAARQTRRLQALAEDLLLLARLDTRTPTADDSEPVDLTALASRLAEQHPLADRPLTLTCDDTVTAFALGNPDDCERLLRNLIDNAARHAAHRIQITLRDQDDQVVLTVHDDGPGVPPEDAERIFQRFVRLDDARSRDQGGTGLGLAIARDLAHRHGGTLTLTPRTLGACFELRLPRAPAPAEDDDHSEPDHRTREAVPEDA